MNPIVCENCGKVIGLQEIPQIYQDHTVCPACIGQLNSSFITRKRKMHWIVKVILFIFAFGMIMGELEKVISHGVAGGINGTEIHQEP